eukprot:gene371-433_t
MDVVLQLNNSEYAFQNSYGFSNKAWEQLKLNRDGNTGTNSNAHVNVEDSEYEITEKSTNGASSVPKDKLATCLSSSVIQHNQSTRMALVVGTANGDVHLAFRNTRSQDQYVPAARFSMGVTENDPIAKIVVTGGNEGVFVSAKTGNGVAKTWHYKYTNLQYPSQARCVASHATYGAQPLFSDIAKFKQYSTMHTISNAPPAEEANSTPSPNILNIATNGLTSTMRRGASPPGTPPFSSNESPVNPKTTTSPYHQIHVCLGGHGDLEIRTTSHRIISDSFPLTESLINSEPIARIPLIDSSPITKIVIVTFGGVDPMLTDITYQLISIHESNKIYSW